MNKKSNKRELMLKVFSDLDSLVSFQSPKKIYKFLHSKEINVTLNDVKEALKSNIACNLIRQKPKNFLRQRIVLDGYDRYRQADLLEMPKDKRSVLYNKGTRFT